MDAAMNAARSGEVAALEAALDAGLSPDAADERGFGLLMIAAYAGREEVVRLLLARGAAVDGPAAASGNTPLLGALFKGHAGVAEVLLEAGADPSVRGAGELTPLLLAATFGHADIARALLARGGDAGAVDAEGRTPAQVAAAHGHAELAALLEEAAATE